MSIKQQAKGESKDTSYFKKLYTAVDIIKNEGQIKRFQLAFALKMTARQYESFHTYLEEVMSDKIIYEKPYWKFIK